MASSLLFTYRQLAQVGARRLPVITTRCLSSKPPGGKDSKSSLSDMLQKMDLESKRPRDRDGGMRRGRPVDRMSGGFRGEYASSAISILHGNYEDFSQEFSDDGPLGGPGTGNPFEAYIDDTADDNEVPREDADAGKELLELEEELKLQGERKAKMRMPLERHQQLDSEGRAYGRGGRKSSTARVWLFPGEGNITINNTDFVEYYWSRDELRDHILQPFVATKTCGMYDVVVKVEGGGMSGKAGAIRHGISRALQNYNPEEFRMPLKVLGLLTRDRRRVEPKKPGRKKARKLKQWVKR